MKFIKFLNYLGLVIFLLPCLLLDLTIVRNRQFNNSKTPIQRFQKYQSLTLTFKGGYDSRFETVDYDSIHGS